MNAYACKSMLYTLDACSQCGNEQENMRHGHMAAHRKQSIHAFKQDSPLAHIFNMLCMA